MSDSFQCRLARGLRHCIARYGCFLPCAELSAYIGVPEHRHKKRREAYIDKGGTEISASYREATDGESAGCRNVAMPAVMPHIYRLR